ncbi:MFS drug efflux transporter [Bombardia bombarda]|uniref:MFS drug efflux transporter n=1 Tax=Bombardia bombarda TaxID=252184 RepID=A0AA39U2E6_9PEZI|nr:MFS drug efflux transporter [Bombardia bombarda]
MDAAPSQDGAPPETSAKSSIKTEAHETPAEVKKGPRDVGTISWILVVASILSASFLFSLDNTIVADVQPAVVRDFSSVDKLSWLPVAFLMGAASTNLLWGQCYGYFDAKFMFMLCVLIFEIGSAVCGSAPNMNALIVGRAICGIGGAGMYTGAMVLISVLTTEQERPIYLGCAGLAWGLGTILGPILGGAFTESSATWRWSFYINLVVGGLCAPVYLFLLPSSKPHVDVKFWRALGSIDYLGGVFICGLFTAGFIAISFGGTIWPWNAGASIALFVVAGILTILFFTQQAFSIATSPDKRLFPIAFLRSPILVMLFVATACVSSAVFVPVYFIPLYYQFVRGDKALKAGINLLPFIAFNVAFAIANGAAMSKKPCYMPWYVFGGALCVVGSALMFTVDELTSDARIWGCSILIGAGSGAIIQLGFTVAQHKVEKRLVPVAVGFCTLAQLAGPAVSLAISNAVFLNKAADGIQNIAPELSRETVLGLVSVASGGGALPFTEAQKVEVIHIIVEAMSRCYIISLTAGAVTLAMSFFMKPEMLKH